MLELQRAHGPGVPGNGHMMRASDFIRQVRDTDSPWNELCVKYAQAFLLHGRPSHEECAI
ncbi:MAG TPA: hypothetical protein VFY67_12190 [Pyrinomonadaceae bacterium]|nr:hypothetical protein [Pyrinomonadaceae bacterium]